MPNPIKDTKEEIILNFYSVASSIYFGKDNDGQPRYISESEMDFFEKYLVESLNKLIDAAIEAFPLDLDLIEMEIDGFPREAIAEARGYNTGLRQVRQLLKEGK